MESVAGMESRTPLSPLTPSQQNIRTVELDLFKLTASQLGITTESFMTFPKEKAPDRSRVAQLKARRRSSIGVRGSPETNSLICFRAKQATKTPPRTPQHSPASLLLSGCDSIKQKMVAFQRLMDADEENIDQAASLMKEEAESSTKDVQSGAESCSEDRRDGLTPGSYRSPVTPPASKRCRRATLHRGLWEQEIQEEPLSELQHTPDQEERVHRSEFKSPKPTPGLGSDSQSQLISSPMLSKPDLIKTVDAESVSKKKRVRFGAPLSPEFFDKTLPPSTPLQKGATPVCPLSSTGRKRSLLKTPQRVETSLPQPDFSSPETNGASPVLTRRSQSDFTDNDEVFMDPEKLSFPIMDEEYDNPPAVSGEEAELHHEPLGEDTELMNAAFQEEEGDAFTTDPPEPEPNTEQNQTERQPPLAEAASEAPRSRGRKRKQPPANVIETRRSSRSAATSAKGKMKSSAAKKRFGSKEVDRSLYGKRDYASKNPLLSPIVESTSSSLSSTPKQPRPESNPDCSSNTATRIPPEKASQSDVTSGLMAAAALWRSRFLPQVKRDVSDGVPAEQELTAVPDAAETDTSQTGRETRTRKAPGRRPTSGKRRRSGFVKKQQNEYALECQTESVAEGEGTAPESESSEASPKCKSSPSGELNQVSEGTSDQRGPESAGNGQIRIQKGRRSHRVKANLDKDGPGRETVQEQTKREEDVSEPLKLELEQKSEASSQSSEPVVESNGTELVLEPWQLPDFSIEEILKPVAKGRSSVRRSLRNRWSLDVQAKGLAWVDHTSPQMSTANRRRRGRLGAVSQPPPDTEEAQISNGADETSAGEARF